MYVWNDQICDGRNDCIDGEDEKQCNTCKILLLEYHEEAHLYLEPSSHRENYTI